jgi:hypothetical protein
MSTRSNALSDAAESGLLDSPADPGAPGDRPAAPPSAVGGGSDGGGTQSRSTSEATSPGTGDGSPGGSGGSGPQPSLAGATFDADGRLASWTVTAAGDSQPWSMFRTYYDAQGNVTSQIGLDRGGSFWINVYDPTGQNRFDHYTDTYDAAGRLVTHTQTNLDGTHTLTAYDTTNSQPWSTFTVTFDAGWNQTSLTGTNHDGTHTIDAGAIRSFMDTLTWYANPHVVGDGAPSTDGRGPPTAAAAMADPRAPDPFAAACVALQEGLASANGRGGSTSDAWASGVGDAFAALLQGLHGLSSHGWPAGASGPSATLLSNGLNADAGVAQLVSALAGVRDGNSAFAATPFAAPSDPSPDGVIAAVSR